MKENYYSELEGMVEFYNELKLTPDYELNTDGVILGNLFEFKKTKSSDNGIYKHKEQLKKYLNAYNSAALPIPSISYLIYLNSKEYIKIDNLTNTIIAEGKWNSPIEFKNEILENTKYLKGFINEYSIVAYNNLFCETKKNATKQEVKTEFIRPRFLNIEAFNWDNQIEIENNNTNEIGWLHFNMNSLGNSLLKKQLGAFFTPTEYVKMSTKYVRNAIKRSIENGYTDYLIIDRCAGTGNLEKFLRPEELEHCILNTYDYTEWTTLKGLYEGRVKMIIPPSHEYRDELGLLKNGDALSKEFNDYLTDYLTTIDRKTTYIIFLENPPFRDETSTTIEKDKASRKTSNWISEIMNNDCNIKGAMKNELSIKFIWSAWKLYSPNEYILYSPIKYWKLYKMFDKKVFDGYISNRKNYNASSNAGLPIINWSSENYNNQGVIKLENGVIYQITNSIKTLIDKTKYDHYFANMFIKAGELSYTGTSLDNGKQIIHDTPCRINKENILEQLPLWVSANYKPKELELGILMKSGDGLGDYKKNNEFLKTCFIWSCLISANKCISNDNNFTNEMTLLQNSICNSILNTLNLNENDKKLLSRWQKVLDIAKTTIEFNNNFKYGLFQIEKELNIKIWNGSKNKKQELILEYKYPELNDQIKYLKQELNIYYNLYITPFIIKYLLIK